jgi:hypothetical protein
MIQDAIIASLTSISLQYNKEHNCALYFL